MLEYAYHLVSFSAGGVAIGAIVGGLWWLDSNVQDEALAEIEAQRDTAETALSSEKFENEHLASDIAFLGKQRDRLQNKYDAADVLIDKLHGELADIKKRALFRNAKGQMYSLNPAKKAVKPVEAAPADRVMAA